MDIQSREWPHWSSKEKDLGQGERRYCSTSDYGLRWMETGAQSISCRAGVSWYTDRQMRMKPAAVRTPQQQMLKRSSLVSCEGTNQSDAITVHSAAFTILAWQPLRPHGQSVHCIDKYEDKGDSW